MTSTVFNDVEGAILAASTCDISSKSEVRLNVLGSTNITSFGGTPDLFRILRFYGTPTITHNGTSMNMPGATNFTPTEGQVVYVSTDSSGNAYLAEDTSGGATVDAASVDAAGAVMNTDTSTAAMQFVVDEDNMSSDSATKVPTQQSVKAYVDAQTSAYELISTVTAANDATVEFTGLSSTYFAYRVVIDGLIPATDAQNFLMRTSADNGSSFDSGASDYKYTYHGWSTATFGGNSNAATSMIIGVSLGNATNEDSSLEVDIFNPSASAFTKIKAAAAIGNSLGSMVTLVSAGCRSSAAAVDAIQFLFASGNISAGTFKLYGIRAS